MPFIVIPDYQRLTPQSKVRTKENSAVLMLYFILLLIILHIGGIVKKIPLFFGFTAISRCDINVFIRGMVMLFMDFCPI